MKKWVSGITAQYVAVVLVLLPFACISGVINGVDGLCRRCLEIFPVHAFKSAGMAAFGRKVLACATFWRIFMPTIGGAMKRRMSGLIAWGAAAVLALSLAACISGARSGVVGSTLTRNEYPRASIAANAPFTLQAYGRQWVSLPTDFLGVQPTGSMDYAVYGQNESGTVTRHAHALFTKPSSDNRWVFLPESYPAPGGLAIGSKGINGYTWTTQVIRVPGENDWFSAMWRTSGYATPEVWIARRFSASPDRSLRIVAEYREPWPECLDPDVKDLVFAREECLGEFMRRSDAAFSLRMHAVEDGDASSAPSALKTPPFPPDMLKLAGELREVDPLFRSRR